MNALDKGRESGGQPVMTILACERENGGAFAPPFLLALLSGQRQPQMSVVMLSYQPRV
jgi:hypothetical protein